MPIVGTTSSLSANAYGLLTAQATVEVNVSGTTINEGDLISFTINTEGIADGNTLYYSIEGTGITASDFTDNALTGSFTVNNNSATIQKTAAADQTTEGTEYFVFKVRRDSVTGTVLGSSSQITIQDTSITFTGETRTYTTTGTHTYTIPSQGASITAKVWGAGGSGTGECNTKTGGSGGYVQGTISVSPGDTINVFVGATNAGSPQGQAGYGAGRGGQFSYVKKGSNFLVAGGGGGSGQMGFGGGGGGNGDGSDGEGVNASGGSSGSTSVTFTVAESAGCSNNINHNGLFNATSSSTGNHSHNVNHNQAYSLSPGGSCPQTWLQVQSGGSRIGLDDSNPGGDGDYNDLTVTASHGNYYQSGGTYYYKYTTGSTWSGNTQGHKGTHSSGGQGGSGPSGQIGGNGGGWNGGANTTCGGEGGGSGQSVSNRGGGGGAGYYGGGGGGGDSSSNCTGGGGGGGSGKIDGSWSSTNSVQGGTGGANPQPAPNNGDSDYVSSKGASSQDGLVVLIVST